MIDVLIPSCKDWPDLNLFVQAVKSTDSKPFTYRPTGRKVSAATNRNIALMQAQSDIVIMMDDDMGGFYDGWQEQLVAPLMADPDLRMVSARLLTPEGTNSPMMFSQYSTAAPLEYIKVALLSACIAFRRQDVESLWFDMEYQGSGFEDTDFCFQLGSKFPGAKFAINNECRLIHYHEMKQQNENYKDNKEYFQKKWHGDGRLEGMVL